MATKSSTVFLFFTRWQALHRQEQYSVSSQRL